MNPITVEELERHPDAFLRRIEGGESLVVLRDGRPVAEVRPAPHRNGSSRPFGLCAGEFTVPADFDSPLPEEVLQQFEGT